jgi:hypothetical protein
MPGRDDTDLNALLQIPLFEPLPEQSVAAVLSREPFEPVQGLFNARWLPSPIRPHYILRSGAVNHLNPQGQQELVALGIKTIFDLRSLKERTIEPDPDISGIECKWEPSTLDDNTSMSAEAPMDASTFSACSPALGDP